MFHLSNNWMFTIGIFPWIGISSVVLFFDPDSPRRFFRQRSLTNSEESPPLPSRISRRLIVATLVFYFCVQLLVPFRHFLYPGNVSWTEEGHNFAWHMKLRSKDGLFRFYVDTPSERRAIDQSKYLTSRQQEEIASEPRLLRKFGRFLRSEYSRIGITECEVRVEAILLAKWKAVPISRRSQRRHFGRERQSVSSRQLDRTSHGQCLNRRLSNQFRRTDRANAAGSLVVGSMTKYCETSATQS